MYIDKYIHIKASDKSIYLTGKSSYRLTSYKWWQNYVTISYRLQATYNVKMLACTLYNGIHISSCYHVIILSWDIDNKYMFWVGSYIIMQLYYN